MPNERILVVDDEEDLLELIRYNLSKEGYRVTCVETGEEALQHADSERPDLIVLDLMLPGVDGLEVCRRLKSAESTREIPIVMLTAKSEEVDLVTGLEVGADDYMTKPFSPRVLLARVRAVLRRRTSPGDSSDEVLGTDDLVIHVGRHEVLSDGQMVSLTHTEFRLLQFLVQKPGWVYSRSQIVTAVQGDDYPVTDRSVDVQIAGLRKKLGEASRYVETVRGAGYRFKGA
jgi:two-component system alkaline phosphatase synthesis response regulator PhoP